MAIKPAIVQNMTQANGRGNPSMRGVAEEKRV